MSEDKILIADSDVAFTDSLACILMENGLKPTIATDMDTALGEFNRSGFDIAVIEYCNPLYRDVVRTALIHRTSDTENILTCHSHSIEVERAARALSPAFFFVKPVAIIDMYAVMVRIIEMKNRRKMIALQRMERREGVRHG